MAERDPRPCVLIVDDERGPRESLRMILEPAHRVLQGTNGCVVGLYGAHNYEPHFGPRADGFRGFTLGLNVASADEVDRVYALLQEVEGAELLEEPFDSPHGFRGFSFRDPEGNIWDVAWKRGSTVTPDGNLTWA